MGLDFKICVAMPKTTGGHIGPPLHKDEIY